MRFLSPNPNSTSFRFLYHGGRRGPQRRTKKMRETGLIDKYTVRELLLEMETLTQVRYSGKYGQILTEITKPQRLIMESLKVTAPA